MIRTRSFFPLRRFRRLGALLAALLVVALVGPAAAQDGESIGDIRREREELRDAEADALAELELLTLQDEEISRIVAEIQGAVDNQLAQVQSARQALDAATDEVRARKDAAAAAAAELDATAVDIQRRAVDSFVGTSRDFEPWLTTSDVNQTAIRLAFIDFTAGNERDLVAELRSFRADREAHLRASEEVEAEAESLRATLEVELSELEQRQATQAQIQAELDSRLSEWEQEAAALAQEAEDLTDLIKEKQAEALGFEPGNPGTASVEGFIMPTNAVVGSKFGVRIHPIFGTRRMHTGVDMGAPSGTAIWAAKEGRVIFAGVRGGYGNAVVIQHEGNVATLYGHMSKIEASEGEYVDQADIIGLVGSTGYSTGPHLHFETRVDGEPKDPELFLPA